MTMDEWRSRWNTGVVEDVPTRVVNVEGDQQLTIKMELHEAPMGDFIKEYVNHLRIPWWRRGHYWSLIEEWMREKLNHSGGTVAWHWR